jgi:YD repeat-containing protein
MTDALGKTSAIAYNDISLPARVTDALGNTVKMEYDAYGRPANVTDQLGYSAQFSYDAAGNLISVTDALGQPTSYSYDSMGRMISHTDARGYTNTFSYTPGGDLAIVTDASGNRTSFSYDLKGRLVQEIDALGKFKSYTYDEDGNLLGATNRRGQRVQYTYDAMKRLIQKVAPERTVDFNYDSLNQITRVGQISFAHDLAGRLSHYLDPASFFRFAYDPVGNLEEVKEGSSEQPIQWSYYDALNRVREKWVGAEVFRFSYDDLGRRKSVSYGDGDIYSGRMKASSSYNGRGELVEISYTSQNARFSYEYDALGRRTSLTDSHGRHQFSYDASGQLEAAKWQGMGIERFGYDASGNMLYNRHYDFRYGPGNRLLGDTCERLRFAYDDDGNMTEKETPEGVTRYRWDSEGRLVGVTKPDGMGISYEYDDLGRKVRKRVGSKVWEWKYLGEDIIEENGPSGRRTYAHGPGIDEP